MIYPTKTISEPIKPCPASCDFGYLYNGEPCDENAVICERCAGAGEINRRAMEAELERMNHEEDERWNSDHL